MMKTPCKHFALVAILSVWAGAICGCPQSDKPERMTATAPAMTTDATLATVESSPAVSFLGITDHASRILFVGDATISMGRRYGEDARGLPGPTPFELQRAALNDAIQGLSPTQTFSIIYVEDPDEAGPPFSNALLPASDVNKAHAHDWLGYYFCGRSTVPLATMKRAVAMKPEVIFYVVPPGCYLDKPQILELFRRVNADHSMRVNTIEFIVRDFEDEKFLKQLAAENGGVFKYVGESE